MSDAALVEGAIPGDAEQVVTCVKPHGGVICLKSGADPRTDGWLKKTGLLQEGAVREDRDGWTTLRRVGLPGAASWTHQYGNPGASSSIEDQRVRDGVV